MSNTDKKSRRQKFLALEVGEEMKPPFPIKLRDSLKAECYSYGVTTGRKFSMKTNQESGTVTVTRKA